MTRGKAISTDLIPDDFLSKEKLMIILVFNSSNNHFNNSCWDQKGLLLSKNGKAVVEPHNTRLINI